MKEGIHPQYYPEAKVICVCGNTFVTGSTKEVIRTDVCSDCHPFFTGEQRIVDTAGQVERFEKRRERTRGLESQSQVRQAKQQAKRKIEIVIEDEPAEEQPETEAAEVRGEEAEPVDSVTVE